MKVLVFGASGGTGRELILQGLAQGHRMTAFVRNPAAFDLEHEALKIVPGDIANAASIEAGIAGQDAAISALGASSLLKRDPVLILGAHNFIKEMEQQRVSRLIYLSQDGVRAVRDRLNPLVRYVIAPLVLRNAAADHEIIEAMIQQSKLNWTIVRPPRLTNGPRSGACRHGEKLASSALIPSISRGDLAEFMLKQLSDDSYVRRAPTVMA